MTNIAEQTLASIVTANNNAVPVFEKHNLDFCCKGKRTLSDACLEKGLSVDNVMKELQEYTDPQCQLHLPFTSMNAEQLISYILIHHHFYVKQSMPRILTHLGKVAEKHGSRFPFMVEVLLLFKEVSEEMTLHMHKEEEILFPRIKELETVHAGGGAKDKTPGYISGPILVMEMEHEQAGDLLSRIRQLTNEYTAPEDACTTFKVSLSELKEFEEDLHRHVHLENNLLFPLAKKMMN